MLSKFLRAIRKSISVSLAITLLPIIFVQGMFPQTAHAVACATGASAQNNIEVEPSHGKVMYIDTGVSPRIDASYIGYRVKNTTGAAINGWWVSLTNFTGGAVTLANSDDQYMQLPSIANGATGTVYFLVKASTSSKVAQTHTVTVYNAKPDGGGSSRYACDFSFTKVAETIKAAANKVTSITASGSLATGQEYTLTVKGATGTIGAGSPDVGKILWFSPAAFSNFPTAALRLESVILKVGNNSSINTGGQNNAWLYKERLFVNSSIVPDTDSGLLSGGETTADTLADKRYYENTYKFRVLNQTPSATVIQPIAQISSGTQIKHTDLSAAGSSFSISTNSVSTALTVTKEVTSTTGLSTASCNSGTCNVVPYRITLSASSGTVTVDEVVDSPASGVVYKTGSVAISSGTISTPVQLSTDADPKPYHFMGPFTVASGTNVLITYQMLVPQTANASFVNSAVAYIGTQQIGASSSTISNVTVTNNSSGTVATATQSSTTLAPVATTYGATSIGTTSATLNGTIDGNLQTPDAQFEWSTNANLSTYTTVALTSPVAGSGPVSFTSSFTGTSGTTYYYRIVAIKNGTRYVGDIFSFTLTEAASAPASVTNVATNILSRSATLNGSIDPNMQTITEVRFVYGTASNLSGAVSKVILELDESGNEISGSKVTLSGANPIDVSFVIPSTELSLNTVYYFRIEGTYSGGTTQGSILSFKTGTTAQTITFGAISSKTFVSGTYTASASASSNLAITYTSETTDVCTVNSSTGVVTFVKAGFCAITASQAGDSTYAPAESVTQQFEITPSAPTATTQAASSIARTTAVLNGTVTTGGGGSTTTTFIYGTDSGLSGGTTVTANESPRTSDGSGTYSLTGLTANTTYYFRIVGTNSTGTASGSILSFTTQPLTAITLTADNKSKNYGDSTPTFTFALTSGSMNSTDTVTALTYRFTRVSPSYDSATAPTNAGVYTITISAATISNGATSDYSITYVTGTYTINKINQATLSLGDRTLSQSTTYTLLATGGSGTGAVSYAQASETFAGSGNCTIASTDQITTPAENGTCTITATKAGDENYNQATANGVMTINSSFAQTITFNSISDRNYSATPFSHSTVSSNSTLDVTLTSNTPSICSVDTPHNAGTTPTITMLSAGTCSITATQAGGTVGGNTYNAASSVTRTFVINKLPQVITFPAITDKQVGDNDENLPAKTDANIDITYTTNDSNICTITGSAGSYKVHFVGAGTCTVTASAGGTSIYLAASNVSRTFNITAAPGSGGGGGSTAPVYVPTPPTIISIVKSPVCSKGSDLIVNGTYLIGATATVDGKAARILSSSNSVLNLYLPELTEGVKTLVVTNADGSASTTVKYLYVADPVFQTLEFRQAYKNRAWAYVFSASNGEEWKVNTPLPAGLVLDSKTGLVSGTPTVVGIFVVEMTVSNLCGSATIPVTFDIDKEIPDAFSCRISFPISSSNSITEYKLAKLKECFDKIKELSPRTIDPVTFLSGGLKPYQGLDQAVSEIDRYNIICELLTTSGIDSQVITGVFTGPEDEIELIAYWPEPDDL